MSGLSRWSRAALGLGLAALLVAHAAGARPGGGSSFSGRSSSGSSFSGSSGRSSSGSSFGSSGRSSSGSSFGSTSGSSFGSSGRSSSGSSFGSTSGSSFGSSGRSTSGSTYGSTSGSTYGSTSGSTYGSTSGSTYGSTSGSTYGSTSSTSGSSYGSSDSYSSSGGTPSSSSGSVPGIVITLAVVLVLGLVFFTWIVRRRQNEEWSTLAEPTYGVPRSDPPPRRRSGRRVLSELRQTDPDFSIVLFEDFAYALYAELKTAQGKGDLQRLAPYLDKYVTTNFAADARGEVSDIVVGSMAIQSVEGLVSGSDEVSVGLLFEVNYTRKTAEGPQGVWAREVLALKRSRRARSRPPGKAAVIGCPKCGAPLELVASGACKYCNEIVKGTGALDWCVVAFTTHEEELRGPMLTGTVEERGTDGPTIVDPAREATFAELTRDDPAAAWPTIEARVRHVFDVFQRAWAARDLGPMRPLMSDALFSTQRYWVAEYLRQGLRNVTEDAAIERVEIAAVTRDAYYDAITVRLWASSLDYTLEDATGKVVAGSREAPRRYSEYWTIIRGRGVKGESRTDEVCPKCGAPSDFNMAGECKYCGSKVTSGEFDWVLSRIEQDEAYQG